MTRFAFIISGRSGLVMDANRGAIYQDLPNNYFLISYYMSLENEHYNYEVEKTEIGRGIKPSSINLIKEKGDLIKVAKSLGLKLNKRNYCKCLYHTENTASFIINKKYYYCYGCGKSGNILDFVQQYTNKNQIESAFYIKKVCGIEDKLEFITIYGEIILIPIEEEISEKDYLEYYKMQADKILQNGFDNDIYICTKDDKLGINSVDSQFFEDGYDEVYGRSFSDVIDN